jgi:hypothetical protein
VVWNEKKGVWDYFSEDAEGNEVDSGEYINTPFLPLRWIGVTGEDYGRSHCEEILGDIETLEAYTKAMIDGMTAASTFWMAVDPAGITDIDDVASVPYRLLHRSSAERCVYPLPRSDHQPAA